MACHAEFFCRGHLPKCRGSKRWSPHKEDRCWANWGFTQLVLELEDLCRSLKKHLHGTAIHLPASSTRAYTGFIPSAAPSNCVLSSDEMITEKHHSLPGGAHSTLATLESVHNDPGARMINPEEMPWATVGEFAGHTCFSWERDKSNCDLWDKVIQYLFSLKIWIYRNLIRTARPTRTAKQRVGFHILCRCVGDYRIRRILMFDFSFCRWIWYSGSRSRRGRCLRWISEKE